jgi:hypothetical protein
MQKIAFFIFFVFLFVSTAAAATLTWTGAGIDDHVSTASNWSPLVVPSAGDDLIFPLGAARYSISYDLPITVVLHSFIFNGGDYSFVGGGSVAGINVSAGRPNLGSGPWAFTGTVFVNDLTTLSATILAQSSNFEIDGPGTVNLQTVTSGGTIRKHGSGTTSIAIVEAFTTVGSITEDGGVLLLSDGLYRQFSNIVVNSGKLRTPQITANSVAVRGAQSELQSFLLSVHQIEISNGATYTPFCKGLIFSTNVPILTGGMLNPPVSCNEPVGDLIISQQQIPVIGSFANFPEGSTFAANGRRFTVTYLAPGGYGHNVRIVPGPHTPFDFDGDMHADLSVFRPSNATWYIRNGSAYSARQWGLRSDKIVPADYDGDGITDLAVYRPSEGMWYIMQSLTSTMSAVQFGVSDDIPVPADFDGDGKVDLNVYRSSAGQWWVKHTSPYTSPISRAWFGLPGDSPVPGHYDGDNNDRFAVFRPSTGIWYFFDSPPMQFGQQGDLPVPADYDGDGKTDAAVYRPSEGAWYILQSSTHAPIGMSWGTAGDIPVPADYDGDGRADVAIYRPSDGYWWINGTTSGIIAQPFGLSDDRPVPAAYVR